MQNTLAIGDILTRPKALGFIKHFGVHIGSSRVLQNTPEKGEHIASIDEFCEGAKVQVQHTEANFWNVRKRVEKILANPKKYDPVNRNCEHTVNEVVHGKAVSPQLMALAVIAILGFLLWLFLRRG